MNPNNYASLEASNRLVKAGIVLETEVVWVTDGLDWVLMSRDRCGSWMQEIPAPSMTEVWRELKSRGQFPCSDGDNWWLCGDNADEISPEMSDHNPTDALIDLLIWVRRDFNAKHDCP